jgi:hypothetical protein
MAENRMIGLMQMGIGWLVAALLLMMLLRQQEESSFVINYAMLLQEMDMFDLLQIGIRTEMV